ncbi:hypothetical protein GCM10018771_16640 [Streptomyces cellulosae]|nr:hypothetical protein GCM10018771_16640 [Streptomyces cellulosae]
MPSTVAVVEDATHGPILFCSGVNHHVADPEAAEAHWGPGLREAHGAQHFTREHAIDTQLRRLGHRPEDVRYAVLALRDDPRTAVAYRVITERPHRRPRRAPLEQGVGPAVRQGALRQRVNPARWRTVHPVTIRLRPPPTPLPPPM